MTKYKRSLFLILLTVGLINFFACKQPETISLKVMSYNIRHGEGNDKILDLSRSADIIKSQTPDLCGLQEIDNFCSRSGNVGQTDYLAQQTQMQGTFGKFMDLQEGAYGMATLSAKPVVSTKVLQLPDGKHEPRSAIVQEIQIAEDHTIIFVNVHFDWVNDEEGASSRLNQAKALLKYIDDIGKACVIVGDFNCTPSSPTMKYFAEVGFVFVEKGDDKFSYQGEDKAEIDHVIYRNTENVTFKKDKVSLLVEPVISDHRPLVVTLETTLN